MDEKFTKSNFGESTSLYIKTIAENDLNSNPGSSSIVQKFPVITNTKMCEELNEDNDNEEKLNDDCSNNTFDNKLILNTETTLHTPAVSEDNLDSINLRNDQTTDENSKDTCDDLLMSTENSKCQELNNERREGVLVFRHISPEKESSSSSTSSCSPSNFHNTKVKNSNCTDSMYVDDDEDDDVQLSPKLNYSKVFLEPKNEHNFANQINSSLNDSNTSCIHLDEDIEGSKHNSLEVQSMDAIERDDYECEQKLTGGVIVKNCSIIQNDRLKLDIIDSNLKIVNNCQQNEEKIMHLDHIPPRHYSTPRTSLSNVKLNLSASLDSADIENDNTGSNVILVNKKLETYCTSSCSVNNIKSFTSKPESSKNLADCFMNGNSNDSLSSNEDKLNTKEFGLLNRSNVASKSPKPELPNGSSSSGTETLPSNNQYNNNNNNINNNSSSNINSRTSFNKNDVKPELETDMEVQEETIKIGNSVSNDSNLMNGLYNFQNGENSKINISLDKGGMLPSSSSDCLSNTKALTETHSNSLMMMATEDNHELDDSWPQCEDGSDTEEVCTCKQYTDEEEKTFYESEDEYLPSRDVDLSSFTNIDTTLPENILQDTSSTESSMRSYRKRKLFGILSNGSSSSTKKRAAIQPNLSLTNVLPSTSSITISNSKIKNSNPGSAEKRPLRSVIPSKENPPPELNDWLAQFQKWSHAERILAVDHLIEKCEPTQVRHMMHVIEPQFQRDFISLLPKELALQVLSYLEPSDLLRAAQTCRSWRFLCDDNLLWKEKCKQANILSEESSDRPKRGRAGNMPAISSPWKAAYMRQHIIESNWRTRPIRDPKVLKGHDDHVITCLQFSGNRIVSGSDDNTLKVWSAISGKCLRTLVGHTGGVWSSQMSGNIIISGSTDRTLKVWNADTGQCVHTLFGHTSTVRCMHLYQNKVVSGSRDATLRVWDVNSGVCLRVLVGHLAAVRCVQYDGKLVVSGAYDYMVKVWNPERQECLHTLQGHTNRVYSLQFDGVHVVSGSLDTSIRVWDVETGSCKHTLMGHQSLTSGMELRQNILVSGNADSTVKVWDIITGQCLQTLSGSNKHQSAVTCLQFNTRFVITSSDDGTVKLWDVKTGEFIRNLVSLDSGGSGGVVWRIRANDTKLVCAVGSRNGTEETKLMVLDFDVEGACLKCS